MSPRGIHFDTDVGCGNHEEDVEDVGVPVSKVQELRRKVCAVARDTGGGNEVLQEVCAFLPVEPLSGRRVVCAGKHRR